MMATAPPRPDHVRNDFISTSSQISKTGKPGAQRPSPGIRIKRLVAVLFSPDRLGRAASCSPNALATTVHYPAMRPLAHAVMALERRARSKVGKARCHPPHPYRAPVEPPDPARQAPLRRTDTRHGLARRQGQRRAGTWRAPARRVAGKFAANLGPGHQPRQLEEPPLLIAGQTANPATLSRLHERHSPPKPPHQPHVGDSGAGFE